MSTTAPLSETAIANMGGLLLDDNAMISLDQGTSPYARFCQREFGYVRDELIKQHPWSFCKELAVLATTTAPAFMWKYAYTLPTDYLRLYDIRCTPNGAKTPYELFSNKRVYTNTPDALYIKYGKRVTNVAEFDPLFARALGYKLGLMAAQMVTGKSGYVDKAAQMFADAMYQAVHTNALEKGSDDYVDSSPSGGASVGVFGVRGAPMSYGTVTR